MLKFEIKIPLYKKEYECLKAFSHNEKASNYHINYYYDSDKYEMDKLDITCSIRESNGSFTSSLKAHQDKKSECSIYYAVKASRNNDTALFQSIDVKYQGHLITYRTMFLSCNGLKVYFDKNFYLNTIDYELEISYLPECKEQADHFLVFLSKVLYNLKIISEPNELNKRRGITDCKSKRFMNRKKEIERKIKNNKYLINL